MPATCKHTTAKMRKIPHAGVGLHEDEEVLTSATFALPLVQRPPVANQGYAATTILPTGTVDLVNLC